MRTFSRILGVLLIVTGIVLFFWQDIRAYFTDIVNDKMIEAYESGADDVNINPIEKFITDVEPSDQKGVHIKENMAGVLKIESAGISEPLFYGSLTEEKLRNGVSMLEDSDSLDMQNIPIAGHRVEGAGIRFNYLDKAEIGDEVELVTRKDTRKYKITDMFEVTPEEVDILDQHEGDPQMLTLITCEDYNPDTLLFEKRLIVQAEIVE